MAGFVIVTHYTVGTPYEDEVRGLIDSVFAVDPGLEIDAQGCVPLGDWQANVRYKIEVIRLSLVERNCPVLYVDSDARFRRYPDLIDTLDCDFAGHWRNDLELLGGTLYFANTPAALRLLREWALQVNSAGAQTWESKILQQIVEVQTGPLGIRVQRLPPAYAKIFDLMRWVPDPVIEHFQASRRLKAVVTHEQTT